MSPEQELTELKDALLAEIGGDARVLGMMRMYWMKRAEVASRSATRIAEADPTNMVKGQMTICYETADEIGRALDALKAKATAGGADGTSPNASEVV